MAFFRRTFSILSQELQDSPIPKEDATALMYKSFPSNKSDHSQLIWNMFPRSFGSFHYTIYSFQNTVQDLLQRKSSHRPFDRLKSKGNMSRRRAVFHFLLWFLLGMCLGFSPIFSLSFSFNFERKQHHQLPYDDFQHLGIGQIHVMENILPKERDQEFSHVNVYGQLDNQSFDKDTKLPKVNKLLIIVTTIYDDSLFEAHYMNRLANMLRLVPPPVLWIVVEMKAQSVVMAEILRKSGLVFRHLICKQSLADILVGRGMLMRNVVLSHVETHKLNGIIFFTNYDSIYNIDIFNQMRLIRHFGTWPVAKVGNKETNVLIEGPVCNDSRVIGWHKNNIVINKFKRFYSGISGFAFNSTILWDPKRWHKIVHKPIRFSRSVKETFQVSSFIGQIVEDEGQMEGLPINCSRVMAWHLTMESMSYKKTSVFPYWFNGLHNFPL